MIGEPPKDSAARIYTDSGTAIDVEGLPESAHSQNLETMGTEYTTLDQFSQSLRLGKLEELIVGGQSSSTVARRVQLPNSEAVVVAAHSSRFDDAVYVREKIAAAIETASDKLDDAAATS